MNPYFSVIIPSYNSVSTISRTVQSVLDQSFDDVEIIVVDDGSTDETREVVMNLKDKRIRYLQQENAGASTARNNGVKFARGKFYVFLDSDDRISDNYLQLFSVSLSSGAFDLGLGFIKYVDPSGQVGKTVQPLKTESTFDYPICGAFAISRDLFSKLQGYDQRLTYSENTDLFLRIELEKLIKMTGIVIVPEAGVYINSTDRKRRNLRYINKKYESMKYFLHKHRLFFASSPKYHTLFKRIYALSAAENNEFREARKTIGEVIRINPFSSKDYFRYLLMCWPPLAKTYYKLR